MIDVHSMFCPQNHPCPVVQFCPTGAITQNGYDAPEVDDDLCTECGLCTTMCHAFREREEAA